ncbi:MAG: TonB-dependent receptor [Bacteroidales bacterium]
MVFPPVKSRQFFMAFFFFLSGFVLFAQEGVVQISGRVIDALDEGPMSGVNVSVTGQQLGTVSNPEGYFYLKVTGIELPFEIRFSMVGYRSESYTVKQIITSGLRVRMFSEDILGDEVVITAPAVEVEQKTFREVITVEMMDMLTIKETPAHNYYEALAYMKGVDITTQSLQFLSVNARGFNSTENIRFRQIVDGMDTQAPGFSFSVGNVAGLPELDVETLEFMPGPSTARYGYNSLNGVLVMTSKDPFQYPGLSFSIQPGVSDLRPGHDYPFQFYGKPLFDGSFRYAHVVGDRLAFKLNAGYMKGRDWYADDTTNIRPGNIKWEWDPGHDGLNKYGDEIFSYLPVGENGEDIPVARTGYRDKYLVDNGVESLKLNASVHYRLTPKITAILHGNYGKSTTVYAAENRIALRDFELYQARAEVNGENFQLFGYTTRQGAGDTYDTRFLAIHLNRLWKSDEKWFRQYRDVYLGKYQKYGVKGFDHRVARAFADNERLLPGTSSFEAAKDSLISLTDFRHGARIINNSRMWEVAGNYTFEQGRVLPGLMIGGNFRYYDLISNGTIFPDTTGNPIHFYEYGMFAELERTLIEDRISLVASLRIDGSEQFRHTFTPRLILSLIPDPSHHIRLAVLTGTRYPGAREQFINKDMGAYQYVGGLLPMIENFELPGNSVYQGSVEAFNQAVEEAMSDDKNPKSYAEAMMDNLYLLEEGKVQAEAFAELKPEKVTSFELGYRGKLLNRIFWDLVYYYSTYRDFIGYVEVNRPRTSPSTDLYTAIQQMNSAGMHDLIYVHTNARERIAIQGLSVGVKWLVPLGSVLSWNATFSKINQDPSDPLVPGFNTPVFKTNISISNRKMDRMENNPGMERVGFNINWRFQSAIDWESPFASGRVDPFATLDWQISYHLENPRAVIKAGTNNFLNIIHTNTYGGAQVGIFYYIGFTMENLFN